MSHPMKNRAPRGVRLPWKLLPWVLPIALLLPFVAAAQEDATPEQLPAADEGTVELDPYDVTTPVGAVRAYIDTTRTGDHGAAAARLNLQTIPEDERATEGPKLARWLKTVLDQKLWLDFERISVEPTGSLDDGLPADLERLGRIDAVDILLERTRGASGEMEWQFSSGTVSRIPELYDRYGYGAIGELLPEALFQYWFEFQIWQWIGLVLLLPASWLLGWVGVKLVQLVARPLVARTRSALDDEILTSLLPPLHVLIALGGVAAGSQLLRLTEPAYVFLGRIEKAAAIIVVTWFGTRLIDNFAVVFERRLRAAGRNTAIAMLPTGRRAAKGVLIILAGIVVLQNLGFEVTGLIAGLGVGGLALALAAQKSLENLFGGVTLIADQPVRVGDFCKFEGQVGTVEEIGLRSTRIRTLDRTLITVPNAHFSEIQIENYAARDRVRLLTVLGLLYETTPDQLRWVLAGLRRLLLAHPTVIADTVRVRFVNFGAFSLDIEVLAYIRTSDWAEFLAIREDLYLRMMEIVNRSGSGFAFPSQTLYLGRDGGVDAELTGSAEAEVGAWRDAGRLPFPDEAPETIRQLRDSVDYPPEGSIGSPRRGRPQPGDDEH